MLADGALSHAMWVTVKLTVIATALNLVVTLDAGLSPQPTQHAAIWGNDENRHVLHAL